ncbi:phosphoinositide phosphatase SAC7-like isoform X2 [Chenopodium quinoa]|uniref:phosphoinositide phosphatase SAC7-like isoform X2 n=1 Tax=Chenopodium quinoa TaxID=63459 RepID=UPI000B774243|nr:phosphoinositide phosphatase SAC7-like isoform X2 [Chenopodium quinoa]
MMGKVDAGHKLHGRMRLWEFPDEYVVEPTDGTGGSFLSVSRVDGSMKLLDELPQCSAVHVPKIQSIYGVMGMLKLLAGLYLFVITERECVGSYLGHPIYKVSSMKILPCDHSLKSSPAEQKSKETEFSSLLNAAEKTPGLYFSYDVNLTLSMQRLHDLGDEAKTLPLWRQADPRYCWNNYMMEILIDNKLDPYLLPILQGTFHNFQTAIGKDTIDVTLVARRCTRRTGTRMWRRGANSDGYVANFVETEQIVQINGCTASFVQVRGSMPFEWEQVVNLKYKPKFEVVNPEKAPQVAERHFLDLRRRYGAVLAVDLVNKTGGEGQLCEMYGNAMQQIANEEIRYLHFDFHRICGHMHFERLSRLYDQISEFLNKNRYLLLNEKGEKIEEQSGVVRSNCIDCLDRTNVTQSMIGRKMLEMQLRRIGVFGAEETISSHPKFDENFKILWANHGDNVSIQYSGTPALKGDYVRYGKRTFEGILNDGWNALSRYYLNNFCDGTKQDAIDMVHGHFIASVSRDMTAQPQKGGLEAFASLPLAFSLFLAGIIFAFMSLKQARLEWRHLFFSLMWASLSIAIAIFVRANGRMFCNRPSLSKPRR